MTPIIDLPVEVVCGRHVMDQKIKLPVEVVSDTCSEVTKPSDVVSGVSPLVMGWVVLCVVVVVISSVVVTSSLHTNSEVHMFKVQHSGSKSIPSLSLK